MERVTETRVVQTGNGTVMLDGMTLQLASEVREQDLARFQSKVTQGDYSFDSDPNQSVWVISSLVGGIGNEFLKEGVDDETYWTGDLETRYPHMITLLPETVRVTGMGGAASPLGDFPASGPSLFVSFGTSLARWVESAQEFVTVGEMNASPTNKAIEHDKHLWIPLGHGGYATVNEAFELTLHDDINVLAFTLWDNKVIALTVDGVLRIRPGLDDTWEEESDDLKLPSGHLPRNLVVFLNQQEDATVHVITNQDAWAYDRELNRLVRTQLQYPRHPDQGLASAVWRGESMYVSVGLGIHSYTGGVISAIGPDGRYGLPASLRGRIVDLEPEYNGMIAVVEGNVVADDEIQDVDLLPTTFRDPIKPFRRRSARSTILRYGGYGWHPVWTSDSREGLPTRAYVSIADNKYRLWWGYAGDMFYQDLRTTFHNPKAGMQVGEDRFARTGSLTTGWFDADMLGFKKLASHIEITLADVFQDGTQTGEARVEYQVDNDQGWHVLGSTSYVGRSIMRFGIGESLANPQFSEGIKFQQIRFRITLNSSDPYMSPVVESFLLKYIKLPLSRMSWAFSVKLDQERSFMGHGVATTADRIRQLATDGKFHEFIYRNKSYRVRVAQTQSAGFSGRDPRNTMQLSVIEISDGDEMIKEPPNDG